MPPFFSIGVTTYNRRQMLKESLSAILDQPFADFEIVVCNDYVEEKISAADLGITDPRVRIINNPKNVGPLANHNLTLQHCNGRYFTWLADDDMFAEGILEAVHDSLTKHGYPKCLYTSYRTGERFEDRTVDWDGRCTILSGREFIRSYLKHRVKVVGNYGFFDMELIRNLGGMKKLGNGNFSPYSDNLLAVSMGELDEIAYIDAPFVLYRCHSGSPSFASTKVSVFRTAQSDFLEAASRVLQNSKMVEDMEENMKSIIKWCQDDIRSVINRSGHFHFIELIRHIFLVSKYEPLFKRSKVRRYFELYLWVFMSICKDAFLRLVKVMVMFKKNISTKSCTINCNALVFILWFSRSFLRL